ncbi:ATP-binding cassette domain-containing protein [Anaerococcus nagyae]
MVAIVGKSGSGKSTILNMNGLLETYDNGEILFKGENSLI